MFDDMPKQPKTVEIPAMTDRALLEDMSREVRGMRADLGLVSNDLGLLKHRVSIIEGLRTEDAMRAAKLSGGVRGLSQSDDGQNMQIASLAVKVDGLTQSQAVQLAILSRLDKLAEKPAVKVILFALGTIATGYLASKGLK